MRDNQKTQKNYRIGLLLTKRTKNFKLSVWEKEMKSYQDVPQGIRNAQQLAELFYWAVYPPGYQDNKRNCKLTLKLKNVNCLVLYKTLT